MRRSHPCAALLLPALLVAASALAAVHAAVPVDLTNFNSELPCNMATRVVRCVRGMMAAAGSCAP